MTRYRNKLPHLGTGLYLTDGGLETTLVFHDAMDLPEFAAFVLLENEAGRKRLQEYFADYIKIAKSCKAGFILESVTWRANPDWGAKLGFSRQGLTDINLRAIEFLEQLRDEHETSDMKMVISGCVGPRGDGYQPGSTMTVDEATDYHAGQIETFSQTEADLVTAMTLNYVEEAVGIATAAKAAGMPAVISFTVETDGRLPTGQLLKAAIQQVDEETGRAPVYYMINCAHPTHFKGVLSDSEDWLQRIRGIRANASSCSHAELDEAEELDEGNPVELGSQYRLLLDSLPNLTVLGGCCGTDHRHVAEIGKACAPAYRA